jgi:hypothetical protein
VRAPMRSATVRLNERSVLTELAVLNSLTKVRE